MSSCRWALGSEWEVSRQEAPSTAELAQTEQQGVPEPSLLPSGSPSALGALAAGACARKAAAALGWAAWRATPSAWSWRRSSSRAAGARRACASAAHCAGQMAARACRRTGAPAAARPARRAATCTHCRARAVRRGQATGPTCLQAYGLRRGARQVQSRVPFIMLCQNFVVMAEGLLAQATRPRWEG